MNLTIAQRIMNGEKLFYVPSGKYYLDSKLLSYLRRAVCLDVSNVAAYVEKEVREFTDLDVPSFAPPWSDFWCEYKTPPIEGVPMFPTRFAFSVCASSDERILGLKVNVDAGRSQLESFNQKVPLAKWKIALTSFYEFEGVIVYAGIKLYYLVDENGRIVDLCVVHENQSPVSNNVQTILWQRVPVLMAIAFSHCKNVTLSDQQTSGTPHARALRKAKIPIVKFKTLEIEPLRQILKREGGADLDGTGLRNALHICRGHFADYRERGLFGKHKGMFWFDQHVRGSSKQGVVVKDYKVK